MCGIPGERWRRCMSHSYSWVFTQLLLGPGARRVKQPCGSSSMHMLCHAICSPRATVKKGSSCAPCVVLQVIVADTFTNLSTQYLGPEALPSQRPFVLLLTGLLVLLMCFPRNLQALGEMCTCNTGDTAGASKQTWQAACVDVPVVAPVWLYARGVQGQHLQSRLTPCICCWCRCRRACQLRCCVGLCVHCWCCAG